MMAIASAFVGGTRASPIQQKRQRVSRRGTCTHGQLPASGPQMRWSLTDRTSHRGRHPKS